MKKLGIMVIALALLVVGMAMADPAIPQVREVQGLTTSTTVIGLGNFNAASNVALTILNSDDGSLADVPDVEDFRYYTTVYTEDTQNSEVGYVSYDKDLEVSTANKLLGQYNIQAVKQITYLGLDASSIVSTDYMMLDGAGDDWGNIGERMICPFGADARVPAFCNVVETGSSVNLKVANMNTQMGERFIQKTSDNGVMLYNNVGVGAYAADVPSKGSVSAFIQGSIKEGGRISADELFETMTFKDMSAFSGDISTYAKSMSYSSKFA